MPLLCSASMCVVCVCVRVQDDAQTLRKMEGHLCPDVCWARLWLRADAHDLTWPNHTIACVPSQAQQDKYRGLNNYLYYFGGFLIITIVQYTLYPKP